MTCQHEDFVARVEVHRIVPERPDGSPDASAPPTAYNADVSVRCARCDESFVFVGAPIGVLPNRPTMSPDGTELRVPLRPQSADPHFGLGIAGLVARVREADGSTEN